MIHIGPACAAVLVWDSAARSLRKELDREPTENEVRARLGYPLVVGRARLDRGLAGFGAGCEIGIPDTRFRVSFSPRENDVVEITLLEVSQVWRKPK